MNLSFKSDPNRKVFTFPSKSAKIEEPTKSYNEVYDKRKDIIEEHTFCTKGIKTSIDFSKANAPNSTVFAYLIFDKC